ncbi:putative beta-galactosidase [Helianthus annuus]|nr:putative beta-galactosidase [Helianthus annuus]
MLQIENEYGNIEESYGQKGKDYVKWAAKMAVGLGAGVPWVMCEQADAPEYIVPSYSLDFTFNKHYSELKVAILTCSHMNGLIRVLCRSG